LLIIAYGCLYLLKVATSFSKTANNIVQECVKICGIVRERAALCGNLRYCAEIRGIVRNYAIVHGIVQEQAALLKIELLKIRYNR